MNKAIELIKIVATYLMLAVLPCVVAQAAIDLQVNGVEDDVVDNIRLHLSSWDELPGDDIESIAEALSRDVIRALQALGYYRPEIEYSLAEQILVIDIKPGSPVVWGAANIQVQRQGNAVADFNPLVEKNPFAQGERIKHQTYDNFKRRLLNTANELGYLDAQLQTSQLRINPETNVADVTLIMEAGERYRLGDITVIDTEISSDLINILVAEDKGEWYSANLIGQIYNRLLESGYFASVDIILDKQPPNTANLSIDVVDSPEHRVSTGVGYGTDTGPRIQLKWHRPHTNTRGNSWNSQLQISAVEQVITTRYRIPYPHPQNRYISFDNGYRRKQIEDTVTQVYTTGLLFHLLRDSGWQYSAGVNLDHERSQIDDEPEDVQTYVIPSARATKRDSFGDPNNPRLSYKFWLDLAHSAEFLRSDTNFFRVNTGVNTLLSLTQDHSLFLRFDVGAISADEFDKVPLSQRFFTGGDQSIRGYKYDTVSPLDENGELIGGQFFTAGSLEYRYRWAPNWQAAIFVDSGRSYIGDTNSCNNCQDTGEEYRTSYGFGVRWQSPVESINVAVDLAFPQTAVGLQEEADDWRFHLYLSTSL